MLLLKVLGKCPLPLLVSVEAAELGFSLACGCNASVPAFEAVGPWSPVSACVLLMMSHVLDDTADTDDLTVTCHICGGSSSK